MLDELKRLVKHSGIFGIGVILSKGFGFFMIPVYTRFLAPKDYGVLELLDMIVFFAGIFAAMGVHSAVFRFYSAYESAEEKKEVISTALLYFATVSAGVSGLVFAGAKPLAVAVLGSADYAAFVRIVAVTLFFSNLTEVPLAFYRVQERTTEFVLISFARTVFGASLLAIALAVLHWGVRGAVYANLVTAVLMGTVLSLLALSRVPKRLVGPKLKEMLRYGAPLIVQSLASFVLVFSDRFFLRRFGDLSEVGVYSLGYKLAGVVSVLVSGPFSFAWQWQQFELAKREDGRRIYAKIQTYQLMVALTLALGVSLFAYDALRVMSPWTYWGAAAVVPLIALSYILADVRGVVMSGILVKKETAHLAWIAILGAAVNLGLNYVLIPHWQMMGAAWATVLSYAVYLGIAFLVSQRIYHVHYEYGRNALALGLATALYLVSLRFRVSLMASIALNGTLMLLFVGAITAMLDPEERANFWHIGRKIAQRVPGLSRSERSEAVGGTR